MPQRLYILILLLLSPFFAEAAAEKKPPAFIRNQGQIVNQRDQYNHEVLYMYAGKGINIQLRKNGYSYELFQIDNVIQEDPAQTYRDSKQLAHATIKTARVDVDFYESKEDLQLRAMEVTPGLLNYICNGREIYGVQQFQKVVYKNVYPFTDIEFTLSDDASNPLKYNVILHPGAEMEKVKLLVKGASEILRDSNLIKMKTALGRIEEKIPFSYYSDEPTKNQAVFFQINQNLISFTGQYNKQRTLVIDPSSNIIWGSYYGGSALDHCAATGVDGQNNVYITGHTMSTSNIATMGAYQNTLNGNYDVYLSKFNSSGAQLWGTYFGGSSYETSYALYVANNGEVYVGGNTASTVNIASPGAHQTMYGGGIDDATLIKFNSSGQLLWATYYGANMHDITYAITADNNGDIVICGHTESNNLGNAIATAGAYKTTLSFGIDAFVAKFSSNGTRIWGSYFGDSGDEEAWGLATDALGNIVFTGWTTSISDIASAGSHQAFFGGGIDAFIAKLDPTGSNLLWATYYGGSADDQGAGLAVSTNGRIYVGGNTGSSNAISSAGCYQLSPGSSEDVFIACFNSSGVRQWGSYYGGNGSDYLNDLEIDAQSNILICGHTISTNAISTPSAYQPAIGLVNTYDAYFAKFSENGAKIKLGSYFGSAGNDFGKGIALDNSGKLYLAGETNGSGGLATPDAHMTTAGGGGDAFLAKFCLAPEPLLSPLATPTLCMNDTYTIYAPNGFTAYAWNNTATVNPLVIGPHSPGVYFYAVTVSDAYGCNGTSDSLKVTVDPCVTAQVELEANDALVFFPIPANERLFLKQSSNAQSSITIEIFDQLGNLLLSTSENVFEKGIDLASLSKGIYLLKYNFADKIFVKKIVKN
jgi:hypothetical protein